jgi:hypothetical protein
MLFKMKKFVVAALLFALLAVPPIASSATVVDPSLIPDGTYVVKVEKVLDSMHLLVLMDNGVETTLASKNRPFDNVKANDSLRISLIKGLVPIFRVQ